MIPVLSQLAVVVHSHDPRTQEAEAGESQIPGQLQWTTQQDPILDRIFLFLTSFWPHELVDGPLTSELKMGFGNSPPTTGAHYGPCFAEKESEPLPHVMWSVCAKTGLEPVLHQVCRAFPIHTATPPNPRDHRTVVWGTFSTLDSSSPTPWYTCSLLS